MLCEVIIPTKSNRLGVEKLIPQLLADPTVSKIHLIADGTDAFQWVQAFASEKVIVDEVTKGAGIHVMWNKGLGKIAEGSFASFINDDIIIIGNAVSAMCATLMRCPELGIVCPNYDGRVITDDYVPVVMTCGGNYVGGGGLGGFCMTLPPDLAREWRFDERMIWWYGDDDVLAWVRLEKLKVAGICRGAICANNESWTITHDPPPDFVAITSNDGMIYREKWSGR